MLSEQLVRNYILENYLFTDDESALANDDSLLKKGIVDSTGILEIILFLQEQFDIKVEDTEMVPDNLDSVNNIVRFVDRKQAA